MSPGHSWEAAYSSPAARGEAWAWEPGSCTGSECRPSSIAERQFNLSFLNTAVDALALVVFGVGLATGIFAGEDNLLLTLLPAALAASGIAPRC